MLPQAVDAQLLPLDAINPAPPVPSVQPQQANAGGDALTRLAEQAQQTLERAAAPIDSLFDPSRRQAPTTSEMLLLQASVSNYTVTLLTLSHLAQSAGSTIQSLTQRT